MKCDGGYGCNVVVFLLFNVCVELYRGDGPDLAFSLCVWYRGILNTVENICHALLQLISVDYCLQAQSTNL